MQTNENVDKKSSALPNIEQKCGKLTRTRVCHRRLGKTRRFNSQAYLLFFFSSPLSMSGVVVLRQQEGDRCETKVIRSPSGNGAQ